MTQKRIIIDDAVPYAEEIFSHLGEVTTLPGRGITKETVKDADALIIRSRTEVNETLLKGSNISFVGSTVVGLDHVDQDYLQNNHIHFYSAQGCNANSVAEYVITALYELAEYFKFDLKKKTLGIIGVGNVGQRVYDKASTLGIKCLLNDPPRVESNPELAEEHNYVDLDECLKADIITVHTPLTQSGHHPTYNLVSADKLASISEDQIIINAARGGIINEQAWVHTAVKANIIDCWENEPYISDDLYKRAWIATPHIAGHSFDAKIAGSSMVYQQLCKFWNIEPSNDWQNALPSPPEPISIDRSIAQQKTLNRLFNKTHNLLNDDSVIRDMEISEVHKKYEYYRRNFPIYREWHQHSINETSDENLNNLLKYLGFSITSNHVINKH